MVHLLPLGVQEKEREKEGAEHEALLGSDVRSSTSVRCPVVQFLRRGL